MSWLLPTTASIPSGGSCRSVGKFNRRAYDRAYYHAKRKGRKQERTPEQKAARSAAQASRYRKRLEHMRALARANYWRHRDQYAAASRERQRRIRASA